MTWNPSRLAQTIAGIFSSGCVSVKKKKRPRSSSRSIGRLFLLQRCVTGIWKWWSGRGQGWGVGWVMVGRSRPHMEACNAGFGHSWTAWRPRTSFTPSTGCLDHTHSAWPANDTATCLQRGYLWYQESRHWSASLLKTLSMLVLLEGFRFVWVPVSPSLLLRVSLSEQWSCLITISPKVELNTHWAHGSVLPPSVDGVPLFCDFTLFSLSRLNIPAYLPFFWVLLSLILHLQWQKILNATPWKLLLTVLRKWQWQCLTEILLWY